MMKNKNEKPGPFKSLLALHRGMLSGQIIFGAMAFYMIYSGNFIPTVQGQDQLLQVIAIVLTFGGFLAGSFLFKKKMQQLKEASPTLQTKLAAYRSAAILQWALLEIGILFSISCFLLVGNYAFLALGAVFILLFVVTGPNKTKMMLLLQLTGEDVDQL